MINQEKILVTGGSGFLGSYILKYLIAHNYENIFAIRSKENTELLFNHPKINWLTGDILDFGFMESCVNEKDFVIHCAAKVSYIKSEISEIFNTNLIGTERVVNACLNANTKKLIHVSSIAAFGNPENQQLINENSAWFENKKNSNYAISKHKGEREVWRGIAEGLNATIICPSIMIGSGNWERGSCKLFTTISNGLDYYPTGSTGFVDVRDVAKFIVSSFDTRYNNEKYILNGANLSWETFIEKVSKAIQVKQPKKPLSPLLIQMFWRLESLKCLFTKKKPIVTKESLQNSSTNFQYDASKSTAMGFEYTPIDQTINESASIFNSKSKSLLEF